MNVEISVGKTDTVLTWEEPIYSTTCYLGSGVMLTQIEGPINGTSVQLGVSILKYAAKDGCDNKEKCSFSITVTQKPDAVGDISQENISISPNPVKNYLLVEWSDYLEREMEIKIYSSQGKQVFERKHTGLNPLKIDVSKLSSGLYFIEVNSVGQNSWARFVKN